MVAAESDVVSVNMNGKTYYLAFAPLEGTIWSFGTMIEAQNVMTPVEQVKDAVLQKMSDLQVVAQSIFDRFIWRSALLLIPLALLLFYISGLMAGRLTRPILQLVEGVKEIAAGNFDRKLHISTGDEIEKLAVSVNSMSEDLKLYTENLAQVAAEKERSRTELEVAAQQASAEYADAAERSRRAGSDDYVEEIARESLGMVMPGETIFTPEEG